MKETVFELIRLQHHTFLFSFSFISGNSIVLRYYMYMVADFPEGDIIF